MSRFAFAAFAFACAHAHAGVTVTMIDLPIPGAPRILDVRPDNAITTLMAIPGALGTYDIVESAIPASVGAACNPLARNASRFAADRIAVVFVNSFQYDHPSIVQWLWDRDRLPVWVGAFSAGTDGALHGAVATQPGVPTGVVLVSPVGTLGEASSVTGPALVLFHADDPQSSNIASTLYGSLTGASKRELAAFSGGTPDQCGGTHLLSGLDTQLVTVVSTFITTFNPIVSASGPAAVEYFNAGFGHYFMTAQDDEIAGLDAGAFNHAFVRTNRSFKVLDAPATGTVPVCRFFTTPGNFGTRSSHFYTADAAECEFVKQNPNWQYEKIAFHTQVPAGGVCPAGTLAVYRAFNNGQTGAPNHRFTTDLALYQQFIGQLGWGAEGIKFCAPT